ncbi:hypothetical protein ETB97_005286, partial [Aspergillus alliaceus]
VLDALILSPSIRSRLFYPAHDAGSNSDASGGETTMYDSFTNAPETHKGESAELEAMNLVDDIASVVLESTSGEYGFTVKFDYPAALPELDPGGAAAITPDALIEAASVDDDENTNEKQISRLLFRPCVFLYICERCPDERSPLSGSCHVTIDRAMSIAGSTSAKNLIDMLRKRDWALEPLGPLKFEAKFERKRSTVVIDSSQEQPMLYFTTSQSAKLDDLQLESQNKSTVPFQIPITTVKELRKIEGLGWKGKLICELMAGTKDSVNGLVISSAVQEQSYHLTGMHTYPWKHSLTWTR